MSLKAFHIVFISASTLLAFGFGGWMLKGYTASRELSELILGLGSTVTGVGLIFYGRYFLRKLKHISYL